MQKFYEIDITRYGDERGQLTSFETGKNIPFDIKRTYYISDVKEGKKRACHAHKVSKRVLTAVKGSCKVSLFDGKNRQEFIMNNPAKAVFFDCGVWCELSAFEPETVILALASEPYYEEEFIRNYDDFVTYIKETEKQ